MTKKISLTLSRSNLKNYSWKAKYFWVNKENLALSFFEEINIERYLTRIFQIYGLIIHTCKISISKDKLEILISYYITLKAIKLINRKVFDTKVFNQKPNKSLNKNYIIKKFFKNNKKNNFKSFIQKKSLDIFELSDTVNLQTLNIYNMFLNKLLESLYIFKKFFSKINFVFNNVNRGLSMAPFTFKEVLILKKVLVQLRMYINNKHLNAREFINVLLIVIRKKNSAKFLSEYLAHQIRYMKRHNILLGFLKRALYLLVYSRLSRVKGVKILIKGRLNGKLRGNTTLISIGSIPIQTFTASIDYNCSVSYTPYGTFGIKIWIAGY